MINTFKSLYTFIKTELKWCFYRLKQMGASLPDKFQSQFLLSKVKEIPNNIKFYPTAVSFQKSKEVDLQESVDMIDTSNVTRLNNEFESCFSLQSIDLSGWDTSNVTSLQYLFTDCLSLQQVNVSNWNTENVTSMYRTFCNCPKLQSVDVSLWRTSKVTTMYDLFYSCRSLQLLDVSEWNTSNTTDMFRTFGYCISLRSLNLSNWNVSKVTNMQYMFSSCSSLRSLIGNNTINDVNNGLITMQGVKISISTSYSPLRYSSILALANGLADLIDTDAKTLTISANSYKYMYNDDDTIPTAEEITRRQTELIMILQNKNWNLAH